MKQPKTQHNSPSLTSKIPLFSRNVLLIGTKTGKCDICKTTTRVLLLKYGFTLCENCLNICTDILGDLQEKAAPTRVPSAVRQEKEGTIQHGKVRCERVER